jgi:drug/metabolite transporter (DMT)-like permease
MHFMNKINPGFIYLAAAASIWGGLYVVSKYVLDIVPPFTLLFLRYLIAFAVLAAVCRYQNISLIPRNNKWTLIQIGLLGYFCSIAFQFLGTKYSSAHMGAVITTLSPVFQSGFAILLLHEPITPRQIVSISLSFAGVLIINGLSGFSEAGGIQLGAIFLLLAALFWGYYSVLSKKISTQYSALQITTIGILIAAIASFPAALLEAGTFDFTHLLAWPVLLCILYVAVVSTAVAFLFWNKGLALVPSHQSGLFFFFQPLVGSFLGWAILGEHLTASFYIGSLLILIAVYIIMKD